MENDIAHWYVKSNLAGCKFQVQIDDVLVDENANVSVYDLKSQSPCTVHEITITPMDLYGNLGSPYSENFELGTYVYFWVSISRTF